MVTELDVIAFDGMTDLNAVIATQTAEWGVYVPEEIASVAAFIASKDKRQIFDVTGMHGKRHCTGCRKRQLFLILAVLRPQASKEDMDANDQ